MALTKITANIIEDGAISTASLANTSITADKLHTTLDLTGKSVTVATATAGDNDTTVASTAFVSTAIANLADSAPETLNTLNELAAALGDDANFSTTVTNSIALKAPLASPTFTGTLTASGLAYPTSDGTNGQVLTTDGAGNLSFTDMTSGADGITASGSNTIIQSPDDTNVLHVNNSANVGIGTNSPDTLLHLSNNGTTPATIRIERNDTTISDTNIYGGIEFEGQDGSAASAAGIRGKILGVAEGATGEMALTFETAGGYDSSTERMRIDSSGNVGIGANNPGSILDIRKTNSGGVGPTLSLINGASVANGNAVDINMAGNPGGGALAPTGRIRLTENASAIPTLGFHLYDGSALGERMTLHQNGSTTLKLSSYASISRLASGAGAVFGHNVEGGSGSNEIKLSNSGYYGSFIKMYYNQGMAFHTIGSSGTIGDVVDSPSVTGTEAMRIDSSRSLFINTTSGYGTPGYSNMWIQHSTGRQRGIAFKATSTSSTDTPLQFFNGGAGIAGQITYTYSATTYSTSSDYRLKENVVYDWDATTRLKQLKPCRFNWIADETNTPIDGFIAHEAAEVVPNSVIGEKDAIKDAFLDADGNEIPGSTIDAQTMDHAKLVPLLVKTIQELEERITALEG